MEHNLLLMELHVCTPVRLTHVHWQKFHGRVDIRTGPQRNGRKQPRLTIMGTKPYHPTSICLLIQKLPPSLYKQRSIIESAVRFYALKKKKVWKIKYGEAMLLWSSMRLFNMCFLAFWHHSFVMMTTEEICLKKDIPSLLPVGITYFNWFTRV